MRILYVEDDARDADLTLRMTRKTAPHLQFETVSTIHEALERLDRISSDPLDLVLTDMRLRDGDGLSLLKHIREKELPLAVVVITGMGDEETAVESLKAQADDYVVKHKDYLDHLPTTLEGALNHYRAERARQTALHRTEEQNRALLNAIPDLMFLLTRDGTYLDYHAKSDDLLLMPPEQFIGKNVSEVMPPDLASQFLKCFETASEKPSLVEYQLPMPDGNHYYEASVVTCEGDKLLAICRDITERKLAEESLKTVLAEVQQLKDRLHEENIYLKEEIRDASNFGEIVGNSKALKRVLRETEQVAPLDTTVLILGETGTGKELLAHAIHNLSPRRNHQLVKVNCGALPAPLIESELFGHEKGAFTGADTQRLGRFALANGGTIFLDEVGELPLELQAKLLRVIEQGEFEMVGSSRTIKVDVRVIAATNRNLSEAVARGTFRSDLFYRLSIFPITMPPLRERKEDLPSLVRHLVNQVSTKLGKNIETIPQSALRLLEDYDWPGNVRELRNVIEHAVILTQGPKLQLNETFEPLAAKDRSQVSIAHTDLEQVQEVEGETLEQSEYRLILRTLKKVHWRVEGPGGAAELLNLNASTLRSRMRKLGISRPKVKASSVGPQ